MLLWRYVIRWGQNINMRLSLCYLGRLWPGCGPAPLT
jgi:hypothetical protein